MLGLRKSKGLQDVALKQQKNTQLLTSDTLRKQENLMFVNEKNASEQLAI